MCCQESGNYTYYSLTKSSLEGQYLSVSWTKDLLDANHKKSMRLDCVVFILVNLYTPEY
uniref:Uncharacterized protein n=1 Tax=Arion vulgaris TaxID=1028688 RepID=A0A0B6Y0N3_9EUPU